MEPLFLKPVFQEKIWGGTALREQFGYDIPSDHTGECWAISGHKHGESTIKNGPYAGQTLGVVYHQHPELFGGETLEQFPLLVKILDANDKLSVQVHPDDDYGKMHAGELGKTECWYIIDAKPDAKIVYGHHAKTKEELKAMIESGDWDDLLNEVEVHPGDFFYVPSGMVHAIGEGILILETQQSSDTTYRVYDYDRKDDKGHLRELHLKESLDVIQVPAKYPASEVVETIEKGNQLTTFVKTPFFDVYRWKINGKLHMKATAPYTLVSVIDGAGFIEVDGQLHELKAGDHFILTSDISSWTLSGLFTAIASTEGK